MEINELEKKKPTKKAAVTVADVVEEQSLLEIFLEELGELNKKQQIAFNEIKRIKLEICLYSEYETFSLKEVDGFANLITHSEYGKIRFDEEGVIVKLRIPLLNSKNEEIANELKILFETNKSRESAFTKKIKVKDNDRQSNIDYSDALIAASIESVEVSGSLVMISPNSFRNINSKDKEIMTECYLFFRK